MFFHSSVKNLDYSVSDIYFELFRLQLLQRVCCEDPGFLEIQFFNKTQKKQLKKTHFCCTSSQFLLSIPSAATKFVKSSYFYCSFLGVLPWCLPWFCSIPCFYFLSLSKLFLVWGQFLFSNRLFSSKRWYPWTVSRLSDLLLLFRLLLFEEHCALCDKYFFQLLVRRLSRTKN